MALAAARGQVVIPRPQRSREDSPPGDSSRPGTPHKTLAFGTERQILPPPATDRRREEEEKAIRRISLSEERRLTALRFLRCGQARVPNARSTNLVVKLM